MSVRSPRIDVVEPTESCTLRSLKPQSAHVRRTCAYFEPHFVGVRCVNFRWMAREFRLERARIYSCQMARLVLALVARRRMFDQT